VLTRVGCPRIISGSSPSSVRRIEHDETVCDVDSSTSTEKKYTLALGLATFTRNMGSNYGLTMAGAVFTTIPMLIVFVAMQRQIIQGISFSGIK
jgi:hypothetical protein